jgi:hypothetical protein
MSLPTPWEQGAEIPSEIDSSSAAIATPSKLPLPSPSKTPARAMRADDNLYPSRIPSPAPRGLVEDGVKLGVSTVDLTRSVALFGILGFEAEQHDASLLRWGESFLFFSSALFCFIFQKKNKSQDEGMWSLSCCRLKVCKDVFGFVFTFKPNKHSSSSRCWVCQHLLVFQTSRNDHVTHDYCRMERGV